MDVKLKSVRAGHRGFVTKLLTKFEELKSNTETEADEVTSLEDALRQKQKTLVEMNNQIVDATPPEEDIQNEYMYNLECKLRQIRKFALSLEKSNGNKSTQEKAGPSQTSLNPNAQSYEPEVPADNFNASAVDSMNEQYACTSRPMFRPATEVQTNPSHIIVEQAPQVSRSTTYNNHRLPKLDLPYFNGDILKWQNETLTPIQKFSYLNAQLEGSAAQTIEGFALTNSNYETAVNLLRERYGQTHKRIHAYMKALMDLPAPTDDLFSLRNYGDKLESYVRGLESLGQSQEMYGSLLVPVVLEKLPFEIRKSIAREHGTDNLDLQNLRKSITREINILETGHGVTRSEGPHATAFFTGTKSKPNSFDRTKSNTVQKKITARTCIFCTGDHYHTECTKVTDANARMKIAKQKQLCFNWGFNCLGKHRVSACKSHKRCKKCNGMHHTSLCKGKANDQTEQKVPTSAVNVVESKEETTEEAKVLHSTQHSNDILLKTAIAPVIYSNRGVESNILFDVGAQRSFITKKLAKKLEIKPTGKVCLQLSAFGDASQNIRNLETATVELETNTGERLRINTLIVPQIAAPLQNQITNATRNLPYLRGLKLAHPVQSGEHFEIDLLIGADYYWEIIQDKIVRGDGPTAVESKIGYLLSGPVTKDTQHSTTSSVLLNIVTPYGGNGD